MPLQRHPQDQVEAPGLPAEHRAALFQRLLKNRELVRQSIFKMDCRVKPGNDVPSCDVPRLNNIFNVTRGLDLRAYL